MGGQAMTEDDEKKNSGLSGQDGDAPDSRPDDFDAASFASLDSVNSGVPDDEVEEFEIEDGEGTSDYSEYNPFDDFAAEQADPDEAKDAADGSAGSGTPVGQAVVPDAAGTDDTENAENTEESGEGEDTGEMENPFSGTGGNPDSDGGSPESPQSGGEPAGDEPPGTNISAGDDVLSFEEHKKMSAEEADGRPKGKPLKLNKRFLLTAIVTVFCLTMVLTFLMPAKGSKKKKGAADEDGASQRHLMDYSLYANRPEEDDASVSGHYIDGEETGSSRSKKDDEEEEVKIPPVIPEEESSHKPYDPNKVANSNTVTKGNGSGLNIPDTRNDRLQGKSIAGIKGLTSTQEKYSTDYYEQKERNAAASGRGATGGYQMPSKEEYMNSMMNTYMKAYASANAGANSYAMQNDQAGKNAFFNGGDRQSAGQGLWLGLNTLWQGTILEATLTSAINTDLPGEITARVAKNVYSSQDGRFLLIPQNSLLFGTYNSSISYAQSRVQVQWNTLVRPDGYKVELGGMNGTDAQGASGIKGRINDHPLAYLKAIGLMSTVFIMNGELTNQLGKTTNQYVQNTLANTQNVMNELGEKLIDRAMNVQPTITIKEGTKINIVVNSTLSLPPCEQVPVTQRYMRNKK